MLVDTQRNRITLWGYRSQEDKEAIYIPSTPSQEPSSNFESGKRFCKPLLNLVIDARLYGQLASLIGCAWLFEKRFCNVINLAGLS